jgi:hypothetical protein
MPVLTPSHADMRRLKATNMKQAEIWRLIHVSFFLGWLIDLEKEAACSSETWSNFERTTRRYIPEDRTLHQPPVWEPQILPSHSLLYIFILTANGFSPGGSGTTIRHNTQTTHITQNNTTIKRNTVHKNTHTHNKHPAQNENKYHIIQKYESLLLERLMQFRHTELSISVHETLWLLICAPLRFRGSHLGLHILRGKPQWNSVLLLMRMGWVVEGKHCYWGEGGGNGRPTPWTPHSANVP